MFETEHTHMSTNEYTLSRLPYAITKGVTATQEGLLFSDEALFCYVAEIGSSEELLQAPKINDGIFDRPLWEWPDVADRLRYREGEPWCYALRDAICTGSEKEREILDGWVIALHRLAAILCDDAAAFRVLHWGVHNLSALHESGDA